MWTKEKNNIQAPVKQIVIGKYIQDKTHKMTAQLTSQEGNNEKALDVFY